MQAHTIAQLREADVVNRFTALTHIQRGSARVVRSMMTDHSTFATFLGARPLVVCAAWADGHVRRFRPRFQ